MTTPAARSALSFAPSRACPSATPRASPAADQALLLSPWPESIFCYEPTWSRLSEHTQLVAVDLPGFGQSERRNSLMAPREMGEFVVRLADAFGLEQPHLVGPDVGTAASLFAAANHPGRFRSLAIGTGGAAVPLQLGGVLKEWVEAPSLEPYRKIDGSADRDCRDGNARALQAHRYGSRGLSRVFTRASGSQVDAVCARLPGAAARLERPASYDQNSGAGHQRGERPRRAAGQRHVPPREIAEQQARDHRRRAFYLGRRCRSIWRAGAGLVGRRPRRRDIACALRNGRAVRRCP